MKGERVESVKVEVDEGEEEGRITELVVGDGMVVVLREGGWV